MNRTAALALGALAACTVTGEPGAVDVGERLPPGQSRAGRVTRADQLAGGPAAQGKVGDWKIYNARVQFIIEDAGPSDGYNTSGGMPIAADLVRAPGEPGESLFGEVFIAAGGRPPRVDAVEVVNDGRDGRPAVIRVLGADDDMAIVRALAEPLAPLLQPINSRYTIDYTLAPDDDALQIAVAIAPEAGTHFSAPLYLGYVMGDGLRHFMPGRGFARRSLGFDAPSYYAAVGERVSYAFRNLARGPTGQPEPFVPLYAYQGMIFGVSGTVAPGAAGEARVDLLLTVGDGGLAAHLDRQARALGESLVSVAGWVRDARGARVAGARVHVEDQGGGHVATLRTAPDGHFSGALPAGEYRLAAVAEGHLPGGSLAVDLTRGPAAGLELPVSAAGTLRMSATEGGAPVPAKFTMQEIAPGPELPESWGERRLKFESARIELAGPEGAVVQLPPGDYRVTASRGFEYSMVQEVVTVPAGGEAQFAAALERVVDTTGWISGDFHVHAQKSPDSDDLFALKVLAFAAEGLEVPVSTEHDFIADFRPAAAARGLERYMHTMVGVEMSSGLGHINAWPMVPVPGPNNGAVRWMDRTIPQVIAELRANPGAPLIQLNHPFFSGSGLWTTVKLDLSTGLPADPEDPNWTDAFDCVELLNGVEAPGAVEKAMPGWFAMLNRGRRVAGTGNSDSHNARSGQVGVPRTYLASPTDDPAAVQDSDLLAAVRRLALTVSGGPFVTASIRGQGPGAVVVEPGDVALRVKVQAPLWMGPMSKIEVIGNGAVVALVDAADARWRQDKVVRFEGDVALSAAQDTWYLVRVYGQEGEPMAPVASGRVFAFTNPIFVDREGDGFAGGL